MNYKRIALLILVIAQSLLVFCQKVEFTYDNNGNRGTRTLVVEQLKSGSVSFPVINPKSLKTTESIKAEVTDVPVEGEISTQVYPNPNKGLIKIEISNMESNSKNEMRLYDLSGAQLLTKQNFNSRTEVDISRFKDGIYILRLKINGRVSDWKIIKSH